MINTRTEEIDSRQKIDEVETDAAQIDVDVGTIMIVTETDRALASSMVTPSL